MCRDKEKTRYSTILRTIVTPEPKFLENIPLGKGGANIKCVGIGVIADWCVYGIVKVNEKDYPMMMQWDDMRSLYRISIDFIIKRIMRMLLCGFREEIMKCQILK